MHDIYTCILDDAVHAGAVPCPCCGFPSALYQFQQTPTAPALKVVTCGRSHPVLPETDWQEEVHCTLYMPPSSFHRATQREAVAMWNAYANGLTAFRGLTK